MTASATATMKPTGDEAELRAIISRWSRALEANDLDAMMADYAPDVLLFDVKPPYKVEGAAAYRRMWEVCRPYFPAAFKSEHRDLTITIGGDLALCHGLHRIVPTGRPDHPAGQTWFRVTAGYRKIGGRWLVVHEHVSVPFDPMTERVAYIADPDATAGLA